MTPPSAPVDPLTGLSSARFGVYVHYPYCISKCPYCDFASTVARHIPDVRYTEAVLRELEFRADALPGLRGRGAQSVYFGGGTPSLWDPSLVKRVLDAIRDTVGITQGAEITLEANPGASDAERFGAMKAAGINRLSIGVQSFQPDTLKFLGRAHDGAMAERAYRLARDAGFENVSLDFIYGVPGQTRELAEADAVRAAALQPEHLSAYALTLDRESLAEEVPLARQLARGEVTLPPDEVVLSMQRAVRDAYRARGLERYEISNYARPGFHSRHNLAYWTGGDYLALGSGATGFLREGPLTGVRYSNYRSAERYMTAVESGVAPQYLREPLGSKELLAERIAMGLRLVAGVDLEGACACFGEDPGKRLRDAKPYLERGLLRHEGSRFALTDEGFDLHSALSARLM